MSLTASLSSLLGKKAEAKAEAKDEKDSKATDDEEETPEPPLYIAEFLGELVAKSRLSDCTFIVGKAKARIPAHRQILAAASPLFEAMLYPNTDTSPSATVTVPVEVTITGVEAPAFINLLKAIYTDKITVDSSNIQECIVLAKRYQIEKLQHTCAEFMEADVNVENACELFELAPTLLDDKDFGLKFIEENADEIIETEAFTKLSVGRLVTLLESNDLACDEFALYKACLRWANAECKRNDKEATPDNIRDALERVIPLIRFPIMPLEDIAATIAPSGHVSQDGLLELFRWVSISDEKEKAITPISFGTAQRSGASLTKDSLILKDKKWKKDILRLFGIGVGPHLKPDKPKPKLTLLYRGSRDGFNASSFHARCDGKGNTFTVIKGTGHPNIFGGYSGESWRSASGTYGSSRCWLYSIGGRSGKPIRLEMSSSGSNVYHNSSYGPTWGGGHDLHVNNNMRSTSNYATPSSYRQIAPGFDSQTIDNTTLAGAYNFTVEEIEVFSVTNYTY